MTPQPPSRTRPAAHAVAQISRRPQPPADLSAVHPGPDQESPMTDPLSGPSRDARQGGDLTGDTSRRITLDLSVCSNRLGPSDSAVRALTAFAAHRHRELGPPPYGAHQTYLAAYADHLGVAPGTCCAGAASRSS
ncbi:hypothetical protein SMD44_p10065 (plasmid) [Streptomyces alboflavus]|uniref:Uncharacterized protein n=1 Tax=Streptomyces alboflavus TaxID=67267 RepID=A0A291W3I7_9ACTN|nr:hypothetical protein [Streptomyces alboflavus]ATM24564.1 hypothetical protein SMD44_p10065 [Streptomyces alboflavus]